MRNHLAKSGAVFGLALALAACSENEAGQFIDGGSFGNATSNNSGIQSGDRNYSIQLGQRFAAEAPSTINFEFDSVVLDAQARAALDQQANWIRQFPEVKFRVYGHTDAVGSTAYNKRLGLRRAQTVVRYLTARGISRSRLEAVVSFGETQPVIATPNRERQNRRTVTEVNGFIENHPSLLDGKYAQVVYREYVESATATQELTETRGFGTQQQ